MNQEQNWEKELLDLIHNCYVIIDTQGGGSEKVIAFMRQTIQDAREEERQFILNILDGIDIADKEMGNVGGGTLAIRQALISRVIK